MLKEASALKKKEKKRKRKNHYSDPLNDNLWK